MNVQIIGKKGCFDTRKAERYFKERRIGVAFRDILKYPPSERELESVVRAEGGLDKLIDVSSKRYNESVLAYTSDPEAKKRILGEQPELYITPIVRCGARATVGYKPEIWEKWELI